MNNHDENKQMTIKPKYNLGEKVLFISETYLNSSIQVIREGIICGIEYNKDLNIICYNLKNEYNESFDNCCVAEHKIETNDEISIYYITNNINSNLPLIPFDPNVDKICYKIANTPKDIDATIISVGYCDIIKWYLNNIKLPNSKDILEKLLYIG